MLNFAKQCNEISKEVNNLTNLCLDKFYTLQVLNIEKSRICNYKSQVPASIALYDKNRFAPDETKRILLMAEFNLEWCVCVCEFWNEIHKIDWAMNNNFKEYVLGREKELKNIEKDYDDNWRYIFENEDAISKILLRIHNKLDQVTRLLDEIKKDLYNNPINEIDYSKDLNKWISLTNDLINKYNENNEKKLMHFNFVANRSDSKQIQIMAVIFALLSSFKNLIKNDKFETDEYYWLKITAAENRTKGGIELKRKIELLLNEFIV